ncbi:peptidase [Burkholderia sp. SFA1]|uniref:peptidoglycan DD-metalloendopeptidase family protein n=1 Tax=unclassified Caballeronia TaxID=2646786 RepID=UPI00031CD4D1|nr:MULTISPECIES: peptidoglycan DD-metalloendopeptidase family protein [unclassified Caballeronia]MCE4542784.1 peptidoglycan DD-metalloendopeptidase family protein [Caballeronia sp. PC1]MCE4568160.1 peptidoglycan DD-metalloendopeptidase family protein [Caballeronia sp. CLC5]BBP95316.1 peptidase [Burkholderia sp. SFA1]
MEKLVVVHKSAFGAKPWAAIAGMALVAGFAGCSSTPRTPAPIVENSALSAPPVVQTTSPSVTPAPVVPLGPATSAAVEPGFYRVKPGDTLYAISRNFKQKPADLATWNNLPESRQVNVGQVLRVTPPGASATASNAAAASTGAKIAQPPLLPTPEKSVAQKPAAEKPAASEEHQPAVTASAAKGTFVWPVRGEVVRKFGASGNKGIDIEGKVGQPVKAAAAGKVVYAGSGLRSYGRMIIVKHSNDYLTAYAYNDKLLVKEGDSVKQGATIADMGTAPTGTPALHFEVRKSGAAVDPMPLLGAGG